MRRLQLALTYAAGALGVDSRGTTSRMAPDAPTPTYHANGNLALGWLMVVRYDPAKAVTTISWTKDGDLYRSTKQGAVAYPASDTADLVEGCVTQIWALTEPALL